MKGIFLKRLVVISILALFFIEGNGIAVNNPQNIILEPSIFLVDDEGDGDFIQIQQAVNTANDGDIIIVYSGTYIENLIIDKKIQLIGNSTDLGSGDDNGMPIIDGNAINDVVIIYADGVVFNGFQIENSGKISNANQYDSAIKIYSNNNTIINNNISQNTFGIFLWNSVNNSIENNELYSNLWGGICVWTNSPFNRINNNNFIDDGLIFFIGFDDNVNNWNSHEIANNSVNGKPLYYFRNEDDKTVPKDAGQIFLVNCSGLLVEDMCLSNLVGGLDISFSSNISIINNTINNNRQDGVHLITSSNCSFIGNNISNNVPSAFFIINSNNNLFRDNNITYNGLRTLQQPTVQGGIIIYSSRDNLVYNNNFIMNSWWQILDTNGSNRYDNGKKGNFYSNNLYIKDDNYDGISERPYYIPISGIDNHPLIAPVGIEPDPIPPELEIELPKKGYIHFGNKFDPYPSPSESTMIVAFPWMEPYEIKIRSSDNSGDPTVLLFFDEFNLSQWWKADFIKIEPVGSGSDLYKGKLQKSMFGLHTLTFVSFDKYSQQIHDNIEVMFFYFPRPSIIP